MSVRPRRTSDQVSVTSGKKSRRVSGNLRNAPAGPSAAAPPRSILRGGSGGTNRARRRIPRYGSSTSSLGSSLPRGKRRRGKSVGFYDNHEAKTESDEQLDPHRAWGQGRSNYRRPGQDLSDSPSSDVGDEETPSARFINRDASNFLEVRRYPSLHTERGIADRGRDSSHPLITGGDFRRAALVLGEIRHHNRTLGGAPDTDVAERPDDPITGGSLRGSLDPDRGSIVTADLGTTPRRSIDPGPGGGSAIDPGGGASPLPGADTLTDDTAAAPIPGEGSPGTERRTNDPGEPGGGSIVRASFDERSAVTPPTYADTRTTAPPLEDADARTGGSNRSTTKHDYLDDNTHPGDDEGVGELVRDSARSGTGGAGGGGTAVMDEALGEDEQSEPEPEPAAGEDDEVPPPEEEMSKAESVQPSEEPFNRDVFLMSILLILATSYAWNVIQSCTTELKFAFPNLYAKRGLMAPWYLAALLRGAVSLVKLGELYDDVEQIDRLDHWTVMFMKTLGLSLLLGEVQAEVMMAGVPTSPAFWFFLGAIPFAMSINAEYDPESPFVRLPDIYLGCVLFLQFLMGITAKRWLMLFNPIILALAFFDHTYTFSSDAYLYLILLNLFYAIAIDKRLHGGPCPPSVPPTCVRCG